MLMDLAKQKRLNAAGFRVGTVAEFLGLSEAESELIEIKLALTSALKEQRKKSSLTQSQYATQIGSSQSRVAKMEAGDPHVSLDLMLRALLALGMNRDELAEVISSQPSAIPIVRVSLILPVAENVHYSVKNSVLRSAWDNSLGNKRFSSTQAA